MPSARGRVVRCLLQARCTVRDTFVGCEEDQVVPSPAVFHELLFGRDPW